MRMDEQRDGNLDRDDGFRYMAEPFATVLRNCLQPDPQDRWTARDLAEFLYPAPPEPPAPEPQVVEVAAPAVPAPVAAAPVAPSARRRFAEAEFPDRTRLERPSQACRRLAPLIAVRDSVVAMCSKCFEQSSATRIANHHRNIRRRI